MMFPDRRVLAAAVLLTFLSLLVLHPPSPDSVVATILNNSASSVTRLRFLVGDDWNINTSVLESNKPDSSNGDSEDYDYGTSNRSVAELIDEYEQYDDDAPSTTPENVAERSTTTTKNVAEPMDNTTSWEKAMEMRFAKRLATLKLACEKYKDEISYSVDTTLRSHLFFSKKYNLMVCAVAKAGSSTWKTHLLSIRGQTFFQGNVHEEASLYARYQLGVAGTRRAMHDFVTNRVMNARHPLDRLVSAYRDKYHDGHPMSASEPFAMKALKSLGRQVGKAAVSITFPEFLTHVLTTQVSHQKKGVPLNFHWKNYYNTCSPCSLHYDYIVKMETYSEDLYYIVKKLGMTEVNAERRQHATNHHNQSAYSDYYKNLKPSMLQKIYKFYKIDFEMFGYDIPDFLKRII